MKVLAGFLLGAAIACGICGIWWASLPIASAAVQAWTWDDGVPDSE